MAANLSNIAFFDISEDQFKNFIPGQSFQSGHDYYGYLDSYIQGDEYLSTICNFAIQIDVDKKITLGRLGEFFMKSNSFWNLLNKYSDIGQGIPWYKAIKTNIGNIETLIGPQNDVSDSWDWNDIILKYNNLIELIYNITGIIGGLGDSNNPAENYKTWNTWKPFNQELGTSGQDILGSIQALYGYLTNILGSNWFKYSSVRGGLNQRVTELENYTGIPITGASGQTSLNKQIEDINTALGKKSDKAGTDTVYGRLKQLETLKDSSSQLSDTIGEFSTGSGGDPLTNKVNDLKTKKATIHDIYQYLNYSQTTNATDNPVSYPLEDPLLTPDHNMITLWARRTGFFQGYRTTYISDPSDTLKWNHRYEFELVPYNQQGDFKIPTDMSSGTITRYLNVLPRLTIERLKSYITRGNNSNSLWPSDMGNPPGMNPMINQVLSHIRAYVRGGGIATTNHLFPVAYFKGGGEYLLYGNIPGKDVLGVVASNIPVTPSLGGSNIRKLVTWAPEEEGDPMNYGDPVFMVHNPILSLPSGSQDGKYYLCDSAIIDIWLHATDDFSQVTPLVEVTFLPNYNGAVISDTLIMS